MSARPARASRLPGQAPPPSPEPRPGRRRARLSLVPAVALLLGALGLFLAAPAQAQTPIWSGTLRVNDNGQGRLGCTGVGTACSSTSVLTDRSFTYDGRNYLFDDIMLLASGSSAGQLFIQFTDVISSNTANDLVLHVDRSSFALSDGNVVAGSTSARWDNSGLSWEVGQRIKLALTRDPPAGAPGEPTNLSVTPGASSKTDQLDLSWTAPPGSVTGYNVHYTSAGWVGHFAARASIYPLVINSWIPANYTGGTTTSHTITGLKIGTKYRVRVRAMNDNGAGRWAFGEGSPTTAIIMTPNPPTVRAGESVAITLTMEHPDLIPSYGWLVDVSPAKGTDIARATFPGGPFLEYRMMEGQGTTVCSDRDCTSRLNKVTASFRFTKTQRSHTLNLTLGGYKANRSTIILNAAEIGRDAYEATWLTGTLRIPIVQGSSGGEGELGAICPGCDGTEDDPVNNSSTQPDSQDPPPLYASLIDSVNDWRNDPNWKVYKAHTDRWDRVLLTLGEPVSDTTLTPMTASEAQGYVDRGWSRWVDVVAALKASVTGTSGDDTLTGTDSGELLVGLGGDDTLSGLGGNDELRGGDGDDTLTGGDGDDRFVFFADETGGNTITDFQPGDRIVLKGSGWESASQIISNVVALLQEHYLYPLAGADLTVITDRPLRPEYFLTE